MAQVSEAETALSPAERCDLHRLVGLMIPAGEEYGVPAANDPAIFADILGSLGRDRAAVQAALAEIAARGGAAFADLDAARAGAVMQVYLAAGGPGPAVLGRVVLQCYYRDDRVLLAVGHEPRAPFPQGHVVEQGDWSLLDPVRRRPQLWRDDRGP
jgi:hypothetical protein